MPVCVMAAAFLLGPWLFLQLPRRVHSPEAGSEGSGGAGSAHQALCSCPRGQLCRARSRAGAVGQVTALPRGEIWVSSSSPAHRRYRSVSGQCGGCGGGLAAVFWSQNHRYAGHTSGRVSGNLPWGRQKLERKATDSGHLLIRQVAWGSEVAEASPGQAG